MSALTVTNIGKAYKRYPSKWARAWEWITRRTTHEKTWVLRDISFTVQPGEAVGIVGVNGAGKSTLLKIITGTTQPTQGQVSSQGRVAALLELGMGFHPDFTGRQNVFMAGQLLGLRQDEIAACMPSIEAFAEIGDYIDQPVRVYSSGMQVRLAFSVATVVRPDILIVDEALSVGDAYFQHKSFERIRELRRLGTTLLIVSHDKGAIQSICDRAILLSKGQKLLEGRPEAVLDYYNAAIVDDANSRISQTVNEDGVAQTISGTGKSRIVDVALRDASGREVEVVGVGAELTLEIQVEVLSHLSTLVAGFLIKDRLGQEVFGTNSYHHDQVVSDLGDGSHLTYRYHFKADIGPGSYSIAVALHKTESHLSENYEWRDMATIFKVVNLSQKQFIGVAWIEPHLEISHD
ncbi:lipopolysaccharide transport system ATP-binding protein [Comamonas odontotermitis]|uniref:Lipopolysaccharide transport system ATP-binding protein n=1 Tax=Comamonas odontotermitis TaxID=379895 RepID=A0ABR6RAT9_9BURK|nr:ABC transporter ATP-binding protein [Comamonas odontotermitis]MBB6576274.1 lipopolysaccharide transport system ATP-binding protein [Comamonas odontotermitis]